jgi:hypothetical protein
MKDGGINRRYIKRKERFLAAPACGRQARSDGVLIKLLQAAD